MSSTQWSIWYQFRSVLGELSVEEILNNKELIKRAEVINLLFKSLMVKKGKQ